MAREDAEHLYPAEAESLMRILRRLRAPDGCPWDRKQTRESLRRHLEGECAELLDAIDGGKPEEIKEELGDLLMNVFFQALVAEERGEFTLTEVWSEIIAKMIRRHRHIFGDAHAETAEDVKKIWQQVKAEEKGVDADAKKSILADVSQSISALNRATSLQKKAAEVGFDWQDANGVADKIAEETEELRAAVKSGDDAAIDEELGDLLFATVNLARWRKRGSAEELLRAANRKFERRFRAMEQKITESGLDIGSINPQRWEALWQEVKIEENQNA